MEKELKSETIVSDFSEIVSSAIEAVEIAQMAAEGAKNKTWGGKREGAGRKGFCEKTVPVCWRISEDSREWIMAQAKEQGVSIGVIIDELVRSFTALAESE